MNISAKRLLVLLIVVHTAIVSYADDIKWKVDSIIEEPTCSTYGTMRIKNSETGVTMYVVLPKTAHVYDSQRKCRICSAEIQSPKPLFEGGGNYLTKISKDNYREFGFTANNYHLKEGHYAIRTADELWLYFLTTKSSDGSNELNTSAFLTDDILFASPIDHFSVCNIPAGIVFDGMGHIIKGLSCNASALFNQNEGTICNLGLVSPVFTSDAQAEYTGFMAAVNIGAVENCFVLQGLLSRESEKTKLGGIVGTNRAGASVENCYTVANTLLITYENSCIYNCEAFLDESSYAKALTSNNFIKSLNSSGYGKCIPWYQAKSTCKSIPTLTGSTRWTTPICYIQEKESTCTAEGYLAHYECEWCGMSLSEDDHSLGFNAKIDKKPHELVKHKATGSVKSCITPHPAEYWQCQVCSGFFNDAGGKDQFQWIEPHNHTIVKVPYFYDCINGGQTEHLECIDCHNVYTSNDPSTDAYYVERSTIELAPYAIECTEKEIFHHRFNSNSPVPYNYTFSLTKGYVNISLNVEFDAYCRGWTLLGGGSICSVEVLKGPSVIATSTVGTLQGYSRNCTIDIDSLTIGEILTVRLSCQDIELGDVNVYATAEKMLSHDIRDDEHTGALLGICKRCNNAESPRIYQGLGTKDIPLVGNSIDGFTSTIPIELNDDIEYHSDIEFTAPLVSYTRSDLKADVWSPLYLPFDIQVDDNLLTDYDMATIEGVAYINSKEELLEQYAPNASLAILAGRIKSGYTLPANFPTVIRPKRQGVNFLKIDAHMAPSIEYSTTTPLSNIEYVFTGHHKQYTSNDWWTLNSDGQFEHYDESQVLKPFHWNVTLVDNNFDLDENYLLKNAKIIIIDKHSGDDDTPIQEIIADTPAVTNIIYNLQGQQVTTMQKGQIYIINNKKILNK